MIALAVERIQDVWIPISMALKFQLEGTTIETNYTIHIRRQERFHQALMSETEFQILDVLKRLHESIQVNVEIENSNTLILDNKEGIRLMLKYHHPNEIYDRSIPSLYPSDRKNSIAARK